MKLNIRNTNLAYKETEDVYNQKKIEISISCKENWCD